MLPHSSPGQISHDFLWFRFQWSSFNSFMKKKKPKLRSEERGEPAEIIQQFVALAKVVSATTRFSLFERNVGIEIKVMANLFIN